LTVEEINAMDKLYALLVGIDAYQPPMRALTGCLNDVAAMEQFLTARLPPEKLSLGVLRDAKAMRLGIIDAFRTHLGQAGPNDTALFYYAGHGSQELTPDLYRDLEPDGLDETLIAYDSRLPDGSGWDLADKELRVLIAEVAERGPHVIIILDSCHSGSATREGEDAVVRQAPRTYRNRPADTFWFVSAKDVKLPKEVGEAGGWRILPNGRHVLLSACQDHETAKEYDDPKGSRRGAFSRGGSAVGFVSVAAARRRHGHVPATARRRLRERWRLERPGAHGRRREHGDGERSPEDLRRSVPTGR
jgi:hypothetical protein